MGGGHDMVERNRVLSVDVKDYDTWDMIYFFEYVKKRRKKRKRCK